MENVHTEKRHGFTIKIWQDEDAENPFQAWDCEPDIITFLRRYDFNTRKEDKRHTPETFLQEAKAQGHFVAPLFMYDHSGIGFSVSNSSYPFNCHWDSGQAGFIFWTKEKREAAGLTDEYIKSILHEGETVESWLLESLKKSVALLNDYVQGNVYGFTVEDENGETVDSCAGFYGDYEQESGVLDEARRIADYQHSPESLPLFQAAAH